MKPARDFRPHRQTASSLTVPDCGLMCKHDVDQWSIESPKESGYHSESSSINQYCDGNFTNYISAIQLPVVNSDDGEHLLMGGEREMEMFTYEQMSGNWKNALVHVHKAIEYYDKAMRGVSADSDDHVRIRMKYNTAVLRCRRLQKQIAETQAGLSASQHHVVGMDSRLRTNTGSGGLEHPSTKSNFRKCTSPHPAVAHACNSRTPTGVNDSQFGYRHNVYQQNDVTRRRVSDGSTRPSQHFEIPSGRLSSATSGHGRMSDVEVYATLPKAGRNRHTPGKHRLLESTLLCQDGCVSPTERSHDRDLRPTYMSSVVPDRSHVRTGYDLPTSTRILRTQDDVPDNSSPYFKISWRVVIFFGIFTRSTYY